eukprot:CAMPEP_0171114554 /NCGR_PEP_ID=MMETSP0766_2-20121228/85576_1 /TAXON_ID=439317 /ORGANISM="Gambierdiscus australes, Strain CAWD 149" /LENGTH=74 /DNA_ID=CAMNT_0011576857 /DNA_START=50 /DNA_END=271 /DNA_ORIENTATION=-
MATLSVGCARDQTETSEHKRTSSKVSLYSISWRSFCVFTSCTESCRWKVGWSVGRPVLMLRVNCRDALRASFLS